MPIQGRLLDNAIRLLRPGGRLVLCTCSLQPEEGEHLLCKGLKRNAAVEIDPDHWPSLNGVGINALNGWLLSKKQDGVARNEARDSFRASLRLNPDQPRLVTLMSQYQLQ